MEHITKVRVRAGNVPIPIRNTIVQVEIERTVIGTIVRVTTNKGRACHKSLFLKLRARLFIF